MKEPKQLNTAKEFGSEPRQQHRYYSIYGGGCLLASTEYWQWYNENIGIV